MKHRFALVSVLSVLAVNTLFIASTHAAGQATNDGAAKTSQGLNTGTIQEPEEAHRLFVEAFNSGNLDALVALYEPEAYIQQREPAGQRLSSDSRSAFRFLSMKPHITLTTRDALRSGELALLRSQWEMTFTGPDGKPVQIAHRSTEWCGCKRMAVGYT